MSCDYFTNIDSELTGIEVTVNPVNTQYKGSVLDKTGMIVSGIYKVGNTEMKSIISDYTTDFDTTTFDSEGEKTVTVTSGDLTTTFKVDVKENTLQSITVKTQPKVLYNVKDKFDPTGLVIVGTYLNGDKTEDVSTGFTLSIEKDTVLKTTDTKVVVTYESLTTEFNIYVVSSTTEVTLTGIEVSNPPVNPQYKNKNLDTTGLVVCGKYTIGDKTIKSVLSNSEYTLSPTTLPKDVNTQTITVTLNSDTTKTTSFSVDLKVVPESIELVGTPTSLTFNDFDNTEFKTKDMNVKIKVNYSDGTNKELTEGFILYSPTISDGSIVRNTNTPDNNNKTKDTVSHNFTVYYTEGSETLTYSFKYEMIVYDKMDYMMKGSDWFGKFSGIEKKNVTSITFTKTKPNSITTEGVDLTNNSNGLVKGYLSGTDIYIVGDYFLGNMNCSMMFYNFQNLTNIYGFKNFDTTNVGLMVQMFDLCKKLTTLDLSSFDTSNVINMSQMFSGCYVLTTLDLSSFDTSNVVYMSNMFKNCSGLTTLDLSSFDTSNVENMSHMFESCTKLVTIYVGTDWSTSSVINSVDMFKDCTKLVGGQGTIYDQNKTDKTYGIIDGGTSNPGYLTQKPTN